MAKKLVFPLFWLANLGVILYFWYTYSFPLLFAGPGSMFIALGRLSGLLAVYFVLLQFIFLGREIWIEQVFGLDKLTRIHHTNGKVAISFILAHPLLLLIGYSLSGRINLVDQFLDFIFHYPDVLQAFLALILFTVIVSLSISMVKKRLKYEFWYTIHLLTYLAIALAWGHQLKNGGDFQSPFFVNYWYFLYLFVFGNVLVFRFLRPFYFFARHQFSVMDNLPETADVRSIIISGKNLERYPVKPGQFMILRFLDRKNWWKPHPFSLSRPKKNNTLRISVKNSGDFTAEIDQIKKGTRVLIDGPYGIFTLPEKQKILFIAGGIGITPLRSMFEEAGIKGKNCVLLYSNSTGKEIVFRQELDAIAKQYSFPIHYFVTQDPGWKGQTGRITVDKIKELVPDFSIREIYICGPWLMMKSLIDGLRASGVPSNQIRYEQFSL